mgnify:CR=1 FL=1
MLFKLALRNIFRQKLRTAMTLAAIVFGVSGLILSGGFVHDIFHQLGEAIIHSQTGHVQVFRKDFLDRGTRQPDRFLIDQPERLAATLAEHEAVAEVAARRAIELNPALDLAQGALAFIEFHWHWRVEDGLARFSEAIRLNPESANLHMWFASALLLAGRPGEALPVAARAQALDPHNSAVLNIMAQAYFFSDDVELALELISTTIEADPSYAWSFSFLSNIALSQGNYPAYLENYARLGDLIGVPRYRDAAEAGLLALAEGGAGRVTA